MPSCVIEYAPPLETTVSSQALVNQVHQAAIASGLFQTSDIKTRATLVDSYRVGEGDSAFVHVTVYLMPGRSDEQRQTLCQEIGLSLQALDLPSPLSLTVQSVEIHKISYYKHVTVQSAHPI